MIQYFIGMICLWLSACAIGPYPIPSESNIHWLYPNLSTEGCPNLDGVYSVQSGEIYSAYFLMPQVFREQNVFVGSAFFEIKQVDNDLNIKISNTHQLEKNIFTKIDGVQLGCANGRLISRYTYSVTGGGETPGYATLHYQETIFTKLPNGDIGTKRLGGSFRNNADGFRKLADPIRESIIRQRK